MQQNIRTLVEMREQMSRASTLQEKIADAITRFAGSMGFVYLHAMLFLGWILINLQIVPIVRPFDPFPFTLLAMIASVEAIFITTFVLISQNRMARISERRADLDLQINLLTEHEVTRLLHLADAIAGRLGVETEGEVLEDLKQNVEPDQVLDEIAKVEREVDEETSG